MMKLDDAFELGDASWPVLVVEAGGRIRRANKAAIQFFGAKIEKEGERLASIWASENTQTAEQFLSAGGKGAADTLKLVAGNAEIVSRLACISRAAGEEGLLMIQFLTEPNGSGAEPRGGSGESANAQKQKLDCALQLARSVSLDFNNALTSVLGHASAVLAKMEPNHPWRKSLLEVEKSAARAAEISNDLASFSRQEKEARNQPSGSINTVLERCVEFFKRSPGPESVAWAMQLERNPFACRFDGLKMQQAFLRVLENAVQALRGQGRIVIQTRNVEVNEPTQDRNVKLAAGAYVCVEISDNGCGIEAEVMPRLFEPFFTTKRDKKHRGLGLAWVYGIVTNHGGGVAVSSQPGEGTSVRIYLPAEKRIFLETPRFKGEDLKGSQTVLLVDDEELVLTMGEMILTEHGYGVVTAASGKQALKIVSERKEPFDLVLTDLVMPAISGREVVENIQRLSPGTRVICMSGYAWPAPQINQLAYLQKPFTAQELLMKIKSVLTEG